MLNIVTYEEHYRAFEVAMSSDKEFLCLFSDLYCHGILHKKTKHNKYYIIERDFRSINSM